MKKAFAAGLTALAALGIATAPVQAAYPERPIQFVIPWPPGDLEDVLTRLIAKQMNKDYGVPAAVVNRPGGGGVVGASTVARAKPDGYTVGSFVIGIPTVHVLMGNAPWKRDTFDPVGIFLTYPFLLAARGDAPYSNIAELAAYAKKNKVRLGHFGYGLIPTRATILAAKQIGFSFSSNAAFDELTCATLKANDADVINTTAQLVLPCLKDIKVLAAFADNRISILPNVPTLAEQVKGRELPLLWNGLFVPKGTPQEVKDKITASAKKALASEAAKKVAKTTGAIIYWKGPAESKKQIDRDFDIVRGMLKEMGDLKK